MNKATFSPVFRRFVLSYLIVLLLPNIAGYLSYRSSVQEAVAGSIENSRTLLNQSRAILETRLNEVETFTKQLAINQDLNRLMTEKNQVDPNNVYGLWKMQKDLSNYSRTNDFLQSYYIYLGNYNVVLTPDSLYYRPQHFFEASHYAGMSFEEWERTMLNSAHEREILPLRPYVRGSAETSVLSLVQSLPLLSFGKPKATIVVTIDRKKLEDLLAGMTGARGGWSFVTDNKGATLLADGIEPGDIAGIPHIPSGQPGDESRIENGMLVISIRSDTTGWLYTAGIPKEAVMESANRIRFVTWMFTAAALAAGLLVALLLAYRNSAPIARLIGFFKEQGAAEAPRFRNEYDFLAGSISNLIADHQQLQEEMKEQLPLLRDSFVRRLLMGEFQSLEEIEAVSSQASIRLQAERGVVGIVKINDFGAADNEETVHELSVARLWLKRLLQEADPELLMTDLGSDRIAIIHSLRPEDEGGGEARFHGRMARLVDEVYRQSRMAVGVSFGNPYQTLRDISRSFEEARQTSEYAPYAAERAVVRYRDTVRETAMYYYPIETQQRLLNTLKAGECAEAGRIMDQLFMSNFGERELSPDMRQQFVAELKGTLLKLMDQKLFQDEPWSDGIKERIARVQPHDGIDVLRTELEAIAQAICDGLRRKKSEQQNETLQTVTAYLQSEYANAELTLYRIAEAVGRPERLISQLFKDVLGENVSDHLERLRIDKASELLLAGERTIDEIAVQVGYNSGHSFRRAFKRVKGVSPSVFRESR